MRLHYEPFKKTPLRDKFGVFCVLNFAKIKEVAKIKNHNLKIVTEMFVYLEDSCIDKSITNDAEDIIHHLKLFMPLKKRRVFYKDTDGRIDEIVLKKGEFSHFQNGDPEIIRKIKTILAR